MLQNAAPAIVLLIAMVIVAWLLQRYRRHLPGAARQSGPALQVLGAVPLGPQQRVVTLRVGEGSDSVCLVLGVTPSTVTALHHMALPPETATPSASIEATPGFAARLAQWRTQGEHHE